VLARREAEEMVGGGGDGNTPLDQDTIEALLFLAEYYKSNHQYTQAEQCCNRLLDIGGPSKEQAKSLLMEIRQLTQHLLNLNSQGMDATHNTDSRHIHKHIHIHIHMHICIHTHMHRHTRIYPHTHTHSYTHTLIHTHTHTDPNDDDRGMNDDSILSGIGASPDTITTRRERGRRGLGLGLGNNRRAGGGGGGGGGLDL
jgi:hypothetical protein